MASLYWEVLATLENSSLEYALCLSGELVDTRISDLMSQLTVMTFSKNLLNDWKRRNCYTANCVYVNGLRGKNSITNSPEFCNLYKHIHGKEVLKPTRFRFTIIWDILRLPRGSYRSGEALDSVGIPFLLKKGINKGWF